MLASWPCSRGLPFFPTLVFGYIPFCKIMSMKYQESEPVDHLSGWYLSVNFMFQTHSMFRRLNQGCLSSLVSWDLLTFPSEMLNCLTDAPITRATLEGLCFSFFFCLCTPPGHPVLSLYQRVVTVNVSSKIGVMTHQYEERGPAGRILCVQPDSSKELNSPTTSLFCFCVKLKSYTRITALSFLFSFIQWVICDVLSDILIRPLIFTEILSHTPNPWACSVSQSTAPSFLWAYPSVTAVVTKDHKLGSLKSQKFIAS